MRPILICMLALIFAIAIVFLACEKSTDVDTDNAPEANFLCGDANCDDTINLLDISTMGSYMWLNGALKDTISAEADNIKGITTNDQVYLWAYLYAHGNDPVCSFHLPDTVLPVSADTIVISNLVVPAGEDKWAVNISLKAAANLYAICFPFHFDCSGGNITCDSIVYDPAKDYSGAARMGILADILGHSFIDSTAQLGAFTPSRIGEGFPPDSVLLASIWFSLIPSADSQTIVIDTTTFPPSNIVIISRFEYPETIASVPVIVYE